VAVSLSLPRRKLSLGTSVVMGWDIIAGMSTPVAIIAVDFATHAEELCLRALSEAQEQLRAEDDG